MSDKSFDSLLGRFQKNIYGSRKGEIRFSILWDYFDSELLPHLPKRPLRVLDAGCGLGQFSGKLLELGHHLTLCDISNEMLSVAREQIPPQYHNRARFIHSPIQELPATISEPFDLVLCHAVLEWLEEPETVIETLSRLTSNGGSLSLMFYNQAALVFRNLIRGNWYKIQSGKLAGDPGGLTPINPLQLQEVSQWLTQYGYAVQELIGLRTFFDYLPKQLQNERDLKDILALEARYSRQAEYQGLARYLHLHAIKADHE